jgi:DNA-binding NarL/FixJ family response regulator
MRSPTRNPPPGAGRDAPIRVLIADRSGHFRETLRRVLAQRTNCEFVGEAATLAEAVLLATEADPNIVLLDFDLVVNESAARLRRLAQAFPSLQVIVLLADYSDEYRQAVRDRWGYQCVAKDRVEEQLGRLVAFGKPAVA